jgi:hypothetical protein
VSDPRADVVGPLLPDVVTTGYCRVIEPMASPPPPRLWPPEVWVQPPGLRLQAPEEQGPALADDLIVERVGRVAAVKADRLGATRAVVEIWRLEDGSLAMRVIGHPTLASVAVPAPLGSVMTGRADG